MEMKAYVYILNETLPKYVPGEKPLSEPMLVVVIVYYVMWRL